MLLLFKNHLICLTDNIFECFFKKYKRNFLKKELVFFIKYTDRKSKA